MPRGTPIRILRLSEALAARGHEVHVMTYHLGSGRVGEGVRVHRIPDVPAYRKRGPGPSYRKVLQVDPRLAALVRRLLATHGFDIIHAHHYEGLLVGAAARVGRKIPLVFDAHSLVASELPYFRLGLPARAKAALGAIMDYTLPRLADHTICVTDVIQNTLVNRSGLDPERVSVVTNGIEVDHFDPDRMPREARAGRTVMFTGNLAAYQGIDLMLRAFHRVAAKFADVRFDIATDSSFAPYEELARGLGIRERIEILPAPAFPDLPRLLARADVAVNPRTDCVGIPVKLLNYMAAARPVASFDSSAPGMKHGKTGWLVKSGDVEALAEGIVTLLADPARAQAIGRAAREYVTRFCNWTRAAKRCEEIYRALLEPAHPGAPVEELAWQTGTASGGAPADGAGRGSYRRQGHEHVNGRSSVGAGSMGKWRVVNPYFAVSVEPGPGACATARAQAGQRFLASSTPRLPLPGCTAGICECRYKHHEDRRSRRERRGLTALPHAHWEEERRKLADRRLGE